MFKIILVIVVQEMRRTKSRDKTLADARNAKSETTFHRHLHRPRYKKQITEGEIKRRPKYCAQPRIRGRNFISSYFRVYAAGGKGRRTRRNVSNKILGCGKRRRAEYRRVIISYKDFNVTFVTLKHRVCNSSGIPLD